MSSEKIKGVDALIRSLLEENVDTIFGYPGGQVIPIYDGLYHYDDKLRHILTRHEQGAVHAAQGYARATGKVGVCIATSGPGATNLITGIMDAMMDSTPIVCITGQVPSTLLGSDAFQEADIISMTMPVTKWNYQVTCAEEIPEAIAKAFYIAGSGRRGPVVVDITKNAQIATTEFEYKRCTGIRSYIEKPKISIDRVELAAELINNAQQPLIVYGQGVVLSGAERELVAFAEKGNIPMASTLLGLSGVPSGHPLHKGMLGMHGNYGPNAMTQECDVLIAVGMRFSDRVTGDLKTYAKKAKIIHIDIDNSEIGKNVKPLVGILADAREALALLSERVEHKERPEWLARFDEKYDFEYKHVIDPLINNTNKEMTMAEVVRRIAERTQGNAVVVTDVGQQQMIAARYSLFNKSRSMITSGGSGTMGYGLPAAIGAKVGVPDREVVLFSGDGGIQMTVQELGTIMQENIGVKIVVLNNNFLGMVRQWQELFFDKRYSHTEMVNPDFVMLAKAYGIAGSCVDSRDRLDAALNEMFADDKPYLLEVVVNREGNVFPMIPAGASVSDLIFKKEEE